MYSNFFLIVQMDMYNIEKMKKRSSNAPTKEEIKERVVQGLARQDNLSVNKQQQKRDHDDNRDRDKDNRGMRKTPIVEAEGEVVLNQGADIRAGGRSVDVYERPTPTVHHPVPDPRLSGCAAVERRGLGIRSADVEVDGLCG